MAESTNRVTWSLPPDLYQALKAEAARKGVSMTALAIEKLQAPSSAGVGTHGTGLKS